MTRVAMHSLIQVMALVVLRRKEVVNIPRKGDVACHIV